MESYPDNKKLMHALWMLSNKSTNGSQLRDFKVTSIEYERLKEQQSKNKSGPLNPNYGKPTWIKGKRMSAEHCAHLSESKKKVIITDEWRKKMIASREGYVHTQETIDKILKSKELNPLVHTKEAKLKIGRASKGRGTRCEICSRFITKDKIHICKLFKCTYCGHESYNEGNMNRYHFENCKQKKDAA